MKLTVNTKTIANRPNLPDLAAAKEHRLKRNKFIEFESVQKVTDSLAKGIALYDGSEADYSTEKGRVLLAGSGVSVNKVYDSARQRDVDGPAHWVDADVTYASKHKKENGLYVESLKGRPDFSIEKADVDVRPSQGVPESHQGHFSYEKKATTETWKHTNLSGQTTTYKLNRSGTLTVDMPD
jgi:hypothetical protein